MKTMNEPLPNDPIDPGPDGPQDLQELVAVIVGVALLLTMGFLPAVCRFVIEAGR